MDSRRPFHEMSLAEYLETADSQVVPKSSILALPPDEYSVSRLSDCPIDDLKILASVWGVAQGGTKSKLAERIVRRRDLRQQLGRHTFASLSVLSRKRLASLAKEAGLFFSALRKAEIARQLLAWRDRERERAARQIAESKHFRIVQKALFRGLAVPTANRERYHLSENGSRERCIYGVPLSVAQRTAPEAFGAARALSQEEFLTWASNHPTEINRVTFVAVGIVYDRAQFWRTVQRAFKPEPQLSLFSPT